MNRPFILLLWGAPASGKSTLAQCLVQEYERRTGVWLCHLGTDRLNEAVLGSRFDGSIRACLYQSLLDLTGRLIGEGRSVLLEGTFLEPRWRQGLTDLAREREVRVLKVLVDCRLALRTRRNQRRGDAERVPETVLEKSHETAKALFDQTDYVFDTELNDAGGLARFLLGELSVSHEAAALGL